MIKRIVKHKDNILRNNSDNVIVGYDYTPVSEFVAEGYGVGVSQVDVVENALLNFTNLSTNTTSWLWGFGSTATPTTSILQNPTGITYSTSGITETVTLTAYNNLSSNIKTRTDYINVTKLIGGKLLVNFGANPLDDAYQLYTWTPTGSTEQSRYYSSFYPGLNDVGSGMTLYYDDNTSSDYCLKIITRFTRELQVGPTVTNGVYYSDTMHRSLSSWDGDTPLVSVTGLTTSSTYKFTFFGSRTSSVATTRYTITGGTSKDATYVDLDTNNNYLNTVSVSEISPSDDGTINFYVYWQTTIAMMNVLEIEEGA